MRTESIYVGDIMKSCLEYQGCVEFGFYWSDDNMNI
jgi:hypothetical protein